MCEHCPRRGSSSQIRNSVQAIKMMCVHVSSNVVQHIGCSEFFNTCFGALFVAWLSAGTLVIFLVFCLVGFCLSGEGVCKDSGEARREKLGGRERARREKLWGGIW